MENQQLRIASIINTFISCFAISGYEGRLKDERAHSIAKRILHLCDFADKTLTLLAGCQTHVLPFNAADFTFSQLITKLFATLPELCWEGVVLEGNRDINPGLSVPSSYEGRHCWAYLQRRKSFELLRFRSKACFYHAQEHN